jgi:hypothetical protein
MIEAVGSQQLHSWKEIASYLGISVRTAQRWECELGLPIKRRRIHCRDMVSASITDLDRWLQTTRSDYSEALDSPVPNDRVLITDLLWPRPAEPLNFEREFQNHLAIINTARSEQSEQLLRFISNYAMESCKAESAGFSLLELRSPNEEIFRWVATVGKMEPHAGGFTPANSSPCGVCLTRNSPQLFYAPERYYKYLETLAPILECLIVPVYGRQSVLGTLWVISHTLNRHYSPTDARRLRDLSELTAALLDLLKLDDGTRFIRWPGLGSSEHKMSTNAT